MKTFLAIVFLILIFDSSRQLTDPVQTLGDPDTVLFAAPIQAEEVATADYICSGDYTLSFWFRLDAAVAANVDQVVFKAENTVDGTGLTITYKKEGVVRDRRGLATDKLYLVLDGPIADVVALRRLAFADPISDDVVAETWYFIYIKWDGTTSAVSYGFDTYAAADLDTVDVTDIEWTKSFNTFTVLPGGLVDPATVSVDDFRLYDSLVSEADILANIYCTEEARAVMNVGTNCVIPEVVDDDVVDDDVVDDDVVDDDDDADADADADDSSSALQSFSMILLLIIFILI